MAKFDGQRVIDRAFDLEHGAAYVLTAAGIVWARRPWRPWAALGGFGKAPPDALRVRFRVYLNSAPGASVRFGRTYRPAPAFWMKGARSRGRCPDGCRSNPGARCPHGFRPWSDLL